jgi:hypothetical protein
MRHTYSRKHTDRHASESQEPQEDTAVRFKPAKDFHQSSDTVREVTFTPLLRRARGQTIPSPGQETDGKDVLHAQRTDRRGRPPVHANLGASLDERLALLRLKLAAGRSADYVAISRSLETLLRCTEEKDVISKGPSSFLDICLRKVPQYISGVQAWRAYEAERNGTKSTLDASDTSFQIYSELESLGPSDVGWRHLRTVLRADGLNAIRGAMAEGLLSDEFSMVLIDLCVQYGAASDAEVLVEELVSRQYPSPSSPDSTFAEDLSLCPLLFMGKFCDTLKRPGLLLRQLTRLLSDGLLPHDWLVTCEFERIWKLADRILSRGQATTDAINFLVTSIAIMSRRQRYTRRSDLQSTEGVMMTSGQHTLINGLSILSAMHLLGEEELQSVDGVPDEDRQNIIRIGRCVTYTLRSCHVAIRHFRGSRGKVGDGLLRLALYLSSTNSHDEQTQLYLKTTLESMSKDQLNDHRVATTNTRQHYDAIISLISSIARICGRGTCQSSHEYLKRLCQRLGQLELRDGLLESITRAGAFFLAQQTNNLRDLIYAENLASQPPCAGEDVSDGRQTQPLFIGYRWEEDIGEWVTVSPVAKRRPLNRRSSRLSAKGHASDSSADVKVSPMEPRSPAVTIGSGAARLGAVQGTHAEIIESSDEEEQFLTQANACQGVMSNGGCRRSSVREVSARDELDDLEYDRCQGLRGSWGSDKRTGPPKKRRRIRLSGNYCSDEDELGL